MFLITLYYTKQGHTFVKTYDKGDKHVATQICNSILQHANLLYMYSVMK